MVICIMLVDTILLYYYIYICIWESFQWTMSIVISIKTGCMWWVGYQSEKMTNSFYAAVWTQKPQLPIASRTYSIQASDNPVRSNDIKLHVVIEMHIGIQERCTNFLMLLQLIQLSLVVTDSTTCIMHSHTWNWSSLITRCSKPSLSINNR